MAGLPPDSRYVTGNVPNEMREGVDLGPNEVAAPTSRIENGVDGVEEHITHVRMPRPAHIPTGPPRLDSIHVEDDGTIPLPRGRALRYDFPLFPDVQVSVSFQGNATADHLEQLTELLNVQCKKLREQEARRRDEAARTPPPRKIKTKHKETLSTGESK